MVHHEEKIMLFWPLKLKLRTLFLLALLGIGGWQGYQYLTTDTDQLVAIDQRTGEILWNRTIQKQRFYYPLIPLDRDRLLLTESLEIDGKSVCFWHELNQQSGVSIWRKSLKAMGLDGCPMPRTIGAAKDGVFYSFWQGKLWENKDPDQSDPQQAIIAMDFNRHKILWKAPLQLQGLPMKSQFRVEYDRRNSLVIRDSQIFAAGVFTGYDEAIRSARRKAGKGPSDEELINRTVLKAFDPTTGDVIWQKELNGEIRPGYSDVSSSRPSVDYNDSFIFSLDEREQEKKPDTFLLSFNMKTGKLEAKIPGQNIGDHLFFHQENFYAYEKYRQDLNLFSPSPQKHILATPPRKILVRVSPCNDASRVGVYQTKTLLLLCEAAKVADDDLVASHLIAIDDRTGKPKWQSYIPSSDSYDSLRSLGPMTNVGGEKLFLGSASRNPKSQKVIDQLQAIATEDGKSLWRLPIYTFTRPVASGDRLLVMAKLPRWQTLPFTRPKPLKP
jgi:outer membrane protein assembly factor BamB